MRRVVILISVLLMLCSCEGKNNFFNGEIIEVSDESIFVQPYENDQSYLPNETLCVKLPFMSIKPLGIYPEVGLSIRVVYSNYSEADDMIIIENIAGIYLINEDKEVVEE